MKTGLGLSKILDLFDSKGEKTWKFSRTCFQVFRNLMKDIRSNYQRLATAFSRLQHLVTEPRSQHLGNMMKKLRSWVYLILYKKYISGKKYFTYQSFTFLSIVFIFYAKDCIFLMTKIPGGNKVICRKPTGQIQEYTTKFTEAGMFQV